MMRCSCKGTYSSGNGLRLRIADPAVRQQRIEEVLVEIMLTTLTGSSESRKLLWRLHLECVVAVERG
jgi:hypothetical protein